MNEASLFCFVEKVGEIELEGVNEQKRRREKVVEKELERERVVPGVVVEAQVIITREVDYLSRFSPTFWC